jgi:pheromone shutdown-related protein TraB
LAILDHPNVHPLTFEGKEITLVGTAHISQESADLVNLVIGEMKPDTVCVELCQSRYDSLTQKKKWEDTDLLKVIKEKKSFLLLSNLLLASFQRKIGQKLGIRPGEEILQAIRSAEAAGATVYLADRDIRITLSRTWRLMSFWKKVKLLSEVLASVWEVEEITQEQIEEMKKKDVLDALLSEIGEVLPEVRRILIDERDQYLSYKIRHAPGDRIVAVVGAGHVPGILNTWSQEVDLASLEQLPPKGKLGKILGWGIPAFIVGLILFGFFYAGMTATAQMVKWWTLTTAVLAAAGAAVAFGHPLTILSAAAAAPFTTLHPLIAAGWVSGLVEAAIAKPKVKDFEKLLDDIASVKGFWRNKITRILLVVVFTNIGASLGTFVAIPLMVKALA